MSDVISKRRADLAVAPNLADDDWARARFSLDEERRALDEAEDGALEPIEDLAKDAYRPAPACGP